MRIKNQKDFWAGIMFMVFGAFFAGLGAQYSIGTAARMRAGYFPTAVGVITLVLGMVISVGGLSAKATEEKVAKFNFLTLLLILGSVVLFSLLLHRLGLIASMLILIAISSYASHEFSWKATLINALLLIVMCLAVFVWGLKLPFHIWPSFISN